MWRIRCLRVGKQNAVSWSEITYSQKTGWLASSVQHKVECHQNGIAFVHTILPITKIVIEGAAFDTQKLRYPDIRSAEYQQGDQMGFQNVRDCVLFRDGYRCFAAKRQMFR